MMKRKYLVSKSNNHLVKAVADNYVLEAIDEPYYYIIEVARDIPTQDVTYWRWDGSKLSVDIQRMSRERTWAQASPWISQKVLNTPANRLTTPEKKFVNQDIGEILTVDDIVALIAIWEAAGSPEV